MERSATIARKASTAQPNDRTLPDDLSKEMLASMFEQLVVGIAIMDSRDYRLQYANRVFQDMLDEPYRRGSLIGLYLDDIIPGDEERSFQRWVKQGGYLMGASLRHTWPSGASTSTACRSRC